MSSQKSLLTHRTTAIAKLGSERTHLRGCLSGFAARFPALNWDAAAVLGPLRGIHCDFEHAVPEVSGCRIGFYAFGKRNLTTEVSITPFGSVDAFVVLFALKLAFSFQNHRIFSDVHFHIILCEAWQVGGNHQFSIAF